MPILPPTAAQPPSYPSDRDALWRAVRALEQRLERPAPPAQAKTGVVTTSRPTVRVLGASVDRDVWRVNSGAKLSVGDEVVCVETALGLVVLSVVEVPPLGPYVAPPPSGPGPNLVVNWLPTIDQAIGGDDEAQWNASGWWSDVTAGNAYFWSTLTGGTWYGSGPVAPYNSVNVDPYSQRTTKVAPCAPGSGYPVTAGTTYAASVYLLQSLGAEAGVVCRVGIEWQDAAGAVLSTSWGAGTDVAVDAYPWMNGATAAVGTWAGHAEAKPEVTATAPAGAVQARPIAETDFTDPDWYGYWYRVSAFSLAWT